MKDKTMRGLVASSLVALAVAHAIAGTLAADATTGTLAIAGAGETTRWLATQLWGTAMAGYALGAAGVLGAPALRSWRTMAIAAGAIASLVLASLLRARSASWASLEMADCVAIAALAIVRVTSPRRTMLVERVSK